MASFSFLIPLSAKHITNVLLLFPHCCIVQVCGSTFNPSCGLDADTLYICTSSGSKPKPFEKCKNGCSTQAGNNVCIDNECTCPGTGDDPVCGYELPASCGAATNTIYICRGGK